MEWVVALLAGGVGAGIMSIIQAALQRHWKKKDNKSGELTALVRAQKVMMVDRVRWLGEQHIARGRITLEEKETLQEMHAAYKELGGNGHLDTVMAEVNRLPLYTK